MMKWFKKKGKYKKALDINFVKGSIGGIDIDAGSISAAKFSLSAAGSIEAIDAVFENLDVDGLTAVNATVSGTIKTADSGQRVILDAADNSFKFYSASGLEAEINMAVFGGSSGFIAYGSGANTGYVTGAGIGINNGTYGGVSFKNDGQNIITGSYLSIDVDAVLIDGSAGISKTIDFGGGKSITVTKGLITNQTGF